MAAKGWPKKDNKAKLDKVKVILSQIAEQEFVKAICSLIQKLLRAVI